MTDQKIQQSELDLMLKKHHLFMIGKNGGARIVYKFKDLSGLDFRGVNISGADFTGSTMRKVNLTKCNCKGTVFYCCDLTDAILDNGSFERTDLRGADLTNASIKNVDLSNADTRKGLVTKIPSAKASATSDLILRPNEENRISDLVLDAAPVSQREGHLDLSVNLEKWDLMVRNHHLWLSTGGEKGEQMNVSYQDLRTKKDIAQTSLTMIKGIQCKLDELYMVQIQMQGSNFSESSVTKIAGREADFRGSNLYQVDFSNADLSYAHFEFLLIKTNQGEQKLRTNLSGASFRNANLTKVRFWDAILDNTDFRGANLTDVDFKGADTTKAIFDT
jgi:uncharacterized protein YjbI with pentapeptide repeats